MHVHRLCVPRARRNGLVSPKGLIVAELEDEVVGFARGGPLDARLLRKLPERCAHDWRVRLVAVLPEARRRGTGSELLRAQLEMAEMRGAAFVWAFCRAY